MTSGLWIVFTLAAAGSQTLRNAMQRELINTLGTVGATHVRFLFGLPFALLFLAVVLLVTGNSVPRIDRGVLAWCLLGAIAQFAATALMLAAMKAKSFVVTTALIKIEPVWVALFGLMALGDHLSLGHAAAILVATAGVTLMSWPKAAAPKAPTTAGATTESHTAATVASPWSFGPIALGLVSGMMFGIAAVGYRGGILAIRALGEGNFVVAATTAVVLGLIIQVVILTTYLVLFDRANLVAIVKAWRPSMFAGFMGALASQMWFLAFAVETAAKVRTLGLVEVLFAQIVSRNMFKQNLASREAVGIGLIVLGVAMLLSL